MHCDRHTILFPAFTMLLSSFLGAALAMDDCPARKVDSLFQTIGTAAPGAAVLVTENGRVLYEHGYGLADVEKGVPMTPTTRVCIASVTKQFTAAAVLILTERGRINLDQPVQAYLPDFSHGDITVRQLLTHTSGLPDFVNYDQANAMPLDASPGDRLNYSNTGYMVLGKLIEKVSGLSYAAFLDENIFKPLMLENTGLDSAASVSSRAQGYLNEGNGFRATPPHSVEDAYAAGGLYSTVEDLYLWDQSWYDNRLLRPASIEAALTPVQLNDGRKAPYGFGWMITEFRGAREISHGGDITGFNSFIARYPDLHFSVVVLSNIGMRPPGPLPSAADLAHTIAAIYLGEKLAPEQVPVPAEVDASVLRSYVGRYRLDAPAQITSESGEIFTITLEDGHLLGESKNGKGELFADSETMFHPVGFPVKITFLRSPGGTVDELLFSLMGLREFAAHRVD